MRSLRDGIARMVEFRTLPGPDLTRGSLRVTPLARSVTVRFGGSGGRSAGDHRGGAVFARSRPSAVLVSAEGRTYRLRVVDVTKWTQMAVVLVALLWLYEMWARARARKEQS